VLQSDPSLAQRFLGWKAAVSLEEGLGVTASWMKANLHRYRPDQYGL
jgi:nucleoside-diphosphate-sugar epimerase